MSRTTPSTVSTGLMGFLNRFSQKTWGIPRMPARMLSRPVYRLTATLRKGSGIGHTSRTRAAVIARRFALAPLRAYMKATILPGNPAHALRARQQGKPPFRARCRWRARLRQVSPDAAGRRHYPHGDATEPARPRHRLGADQGCTADDPRRWPEGHRRMRLCGRLPAQAPRICRPGGLTTVLVLDLRRQPA